LGCAKQPVVRVVVDETKDTTNTTSWSFKKTLIIGTVVVGLCIALGYGLKCLYIAQYNKYLNNLIPSDKKEKVNKFIKNKEKEGAAAGNLTAAQYNLSVAQTAIELHQESLKEAEGKKNCPAAYEATI